MAASLKSFCGIFSLHLEQKQLFSCISKSLDKRILNRKQTSAFQRCSKVKYSTSSNQTASEVSENLEEDSETVKIRLKILDAAVAYVPDYGWSRHALAAGAESLGLPGVAHGMVEGGGEELFLTFNYFNNRKLDKILRARYADPNSCKDLRTYFYDALKTRLEMMEPVSQRLSEALALMAQPSCIPDDIELLMDLSKVVWSYTGDKNIYLKWYTKRLSLAAAYRLSELRLMQNSSPDHSDTWEFLRDQVEKLIRADKAVDEVEKGISGIADFASGALITVRNLIGANHRR